MLVRASLVQGEEEEELVFIDIDLLIYLHIFVPIFIYLLIYPINQSFSKPINHLANFVALYVTHNLFLMNIIHFNESVI